MAAPWLSYVPIPGLAFIAVWVAPDDPLTRYHAWQGGLMVVLSYVLVLMLGLIGLSSSASWFAATIGGLSGALLVALLVGVVWGIVAAARGRYDRIRPVWDLLSALQR